MPGLHCCVPLLPALPFSFAFCPFCCLSAAAVFYAAYRFAFRTLCRAQFFLRCTCVALCGLLRLVGWTAVLVFVCGRCAACGCCRAVAAGFFCCHLLLLFPAATFLPFCSPAARLFD
jgi:hypothetical protein